MIDESTEKSVHVVISKKYFFKSLFKLQVVVDELFGRNVVFACHRVNQFVIKAPQVFGCNDCECLVVSALK